MWRKPLCTCLLLAALAWTAPPGAAGVRTSAVELPDGRPYEIPWPSIWPRRRIIWVNAGYGNDANDGTTPAKAVRTLIRAFDMARSPRPAAAAAAAAAAPLPPGLGAV